MPPDEPYERKLQVLELNYLNKRLRAKEAENECGLAYELLIAARRQFLEDKLGGRNCDPSRV